MTTRRRLLEHWWVLPVAGTLGAFGYMGWYAGKVTFGKKEAGKPQFERSDSQPLAELTALENVWDSLDFKYAGRECVLLCVPIPIEGGLSHAGRHYVAYSRVCTHLGCLVNVVREEEVLAFAFNYRPPEGAKHPQLGCRCHFSVFNPLKGGEAVFGKANSPLPRVELSINNGKIYAIGIEPAPPIGG